MSSLCCQAELKKQYLVDNVVACFLFEQECIFYQIMLAETVVNSYEWDN